MKNLVRVHSCDETILKNRALQMMKVFTVQFYEILAILKGNSTGGDMNMY